MKERELRRLLQRTEAPGEREAGRRVGRVVRAAFAARDVEPRQPRYRRALVAVAIAAAVVAAVLSPPGRAVIESVREAVGVERAAPALFRLPSSGLLLVNSDAGAWIVRPDGSKRLLGRYTDAAWSPHGLYVVAARENLLAALDPKGQVRWSLARPDVRLPRWGGSRVDTRIAYLSAGGLRVVAGDGSGDHTCASAGVAPVAPAWRPGPPHVLAFAAAGGEVNVYAVDRCTLYWRSAAFPNPRLLAWSADGRRLVLVTRDEIVVFAWNRRRPLLERRLSGAVHVAFAPRGHRLVVVRPREVLLLDADQPPLRPRRVFAGAGRFTDAVWSPDARWLLVAWNDADQWIFVRMPGARRITAVSDISAQFEGGRFPSVAGWCC